MFFQPMINCWFGILRVPLSNTTISFSGIPGIQSTRPQTIGWFSIRDAPWRRCFGRNRSNRSGISQALTCSSGTPGSFFFGGSVPEPQHSSIVFLFRLGGHKKPWKRGFPRPWLFITICKCICVYMHILLHTRKYLHNDLPCETKRGRT